MKAFVVYGPKIIASRERFSDEALESRCLTQYMMSRNDIPTAIMLPNEFEGEALLLRNKLLMFRFKNYERVEADESCVTELKVPRVRQTMLALLSTAKLIKNSVAEKIMAFAKDYERDLISVQKVSPEADIVICILRLMRTGIKKIHMKDIADRHNEDFGNGGEHVNYGDLLPQRLNMTAHKIGHIVQKKLHIRKDRDNNGIYIPVEQEGEQINSLVERYAITDEMLATEDDEGNITPPIKELTS